MGGGEGGVGAKRQRGWQTRIPKKWWRGKKFREGSSKNVKDRGKCFLTECRGAATSIQGRLFKNFFDPPSPPGFLRFSGETRGSKSNENFGAKI